MSSDATEPLLGELVRGLRPVRRLPRLGGVLAGVLALWASSVAVQGALGGPVPHVPSGRGVHLPSLIVLVGLCITALGALPAALAGAVPGREWLARATRLLALVGVTLSVAGGAWAELWLGPGDSSLTGCLDCLGRECALGLLPAVLIGAFLGRACGRRPAVAAVLGALGAVALGAVAVQVSCASHGALHMLVAHSLMPFAAALLLAAPLGLWLHVCAQRA